MGGDATVTIDEPDWLNDVPGWFDQVVNPTPADQVAVVAQLQATGADITGTITASSTAATDAIVGAINAIEQPEPPEPEEPVDLQPLVDAVTTSTAELKAAIEAGQTDLQPLTDAVGQASTDLQAAIAAIPPTDLDPLVSTMATGTQTLVDAIGEIPPTDLLPLIDAIQGLEPTDLQPLVDAVSTATAELKAAIDAGKTDLDPLVTAVQTTSADLKAAIEMIPEVDLDPVVHGISIAATDLINAIGEKEPVDLQPLIDKVIEQTTEQQRQHDLLITSVNDAATGVGQLIDRGFDRNATEIKAIGTDLGIKIGETTSVISGVGERIGNTLDGIDDKMGTPDGDCRTNPEGCTGLGEGVPWGVPDSGGGPTGNKEGIPDFEYDPDETPSIYEALEQFQTDVRQSGLMEIPQLNCMSSGGINCEALRLSFFGRNYTVDLHCTLFNIIAPYLQAAVWVMAGLGATKAVLSA